MQVIELLRLNEDDSIYINTAGVLIAAEIDKLLYEQERGTN